MPYHFGGRKRDPDLENYPYAGGVGVEVGGANPLSPQVRSSGRSVIFVRRPLAFVPLVMITVLLEGTARRRWQESKLQASSFVAFLRLLGGSSLVTGDGSGFMRAVSFIVFLSPLLLSGTGVMSVRCSTDRTIMDALVSAIITACQGAQ